MSRVYLLALAFTFAFSSHLTRPAYAVDVTVTYSIADGYLHGPHLNGPVTSGTLAIVWEDATGLFTHTGHARLVNLTLKGGSAPYTGTFSITSGANFTLGSAWINGWQDVAKGWDVRIDQYNEAWIPGLSVTAARFNWEAYGPYHAPRTTAGDVIYRNYISGIVAPFALNLPFSHRFSFHHPQGGEVSRVPEPASGSLVLLGLVGLAVAGGARRFMRHR